MRKNWPVGRKTATFLVGASPQSDVPQIGPERPRVFFESDGSGGRIGADSAGDLASGRWGNVPDAAPPAMVRFFSTKSNESRTRHRAKLDFSSRIDLARKFPASVLGQRRRIDIGQHARDPIEVPPWAARPVSELLLPPLPVMTPWCSPYVRLSNA